MLCIMHLVQTLPIDGKILTLIDEYKLIIIIIKLTLFLGGHVKKN